MKRRLYILTALTLPFVVLSSCKIMNDPLWDESSSERVQNIIDDAFATLTSSDEGWYFSDCLGYGTNVGTGGYWMWCRFYNNYTVKAMCESLYSYSEGYSAYNDPDLLVVPNYQVDSTQFSLKRGRGAVLSFDVGNSVLHYFSEPSAGAVSGKEGDFEFTIVDVADNVVTVRGIKTNKTMYFNRKTNTNVVSADLHAVRKAEIKMKDCHAWAIEVDGAITTGPPADSTYIKEGFVILNDTGDTTAPAPPTFSLNGRVFSVLFYVDAGMTEIERENEATGEVYKETVHAVNKYDLILPFIVDMDMEEMGVTLTSPATADGKVITGFDFTYDGEQLGYPVGVLTSNDPGGMIRIRHEFLPPVSFADLIGTYTMNGTSFQSGASQRIAGTVISQVATNRVKFEYAGVGYTFPFEATFDPEKQTLTAVSPQNTGWNSGGTPIYFKNANMINVVPADPVVWTTHGGLITSKDSAWGYFVGENTTPFNSSWWSYTQFVKD